MQRFRAGLCATSDEPRPEEAADCAGGHEAPVELRRRGQFAQPQVHAADPLRVQPEAPVRGANYILVLRS